MKHDSRIPQAAIDACPYGFCGALAPDDVTLVGDFEPRWVFCGYADGHDGPHSWGR